VSVCLSVCPFVYLTHPNFAKFSTHVACIAGARSSSARQRCDTLCVSGFVDGLNFADSQSKTTQVERLYNILGVTYPGAEPVGCGV